MNIWRFNWPMLCCCRDTFRRILDAKFVLPDTISPDAADLITQLLQVPGKEVCP